MYLLNSGDSHTLPARLSCYWLTTFCHYWLLLPFFRKFHWLSTTEIPVIPWIVQCQIHFKVWRVLITYDFQLENNCLPIHVTSLFFLKPINNIFVLLWMVLLNFNFNFFVYTFKGPQCESFSSSIMIIAQIDFTWPVLVCSVINFNNSHRLLPLLYR